MRLWSMLCAGLVIAVAAGSVFAGEKERNRPEKGDRVAGVVVAVQNNALKLQVMREGGASQEITLAINAQTVITVNGERGTLDQIQPGMRAMALVSDGVASRLMAKSEPSAEQKKAREEEREHKREAKREGGKKPEGARDGEKKKGDGAREGEKKKGDGPRDGQPKPAGPRDGE